MHAHSEAIIHNCIINVGQSITEKPNGLTLYCRQYIICTALYSIIYALYTVFWAYALWAAEQLHYIRWQAEFCIAHYAYVQAFACMCARGKMGLVRLLRLNYYKLWQVGWILHGKSNKVTQNFWSCSPESKNRDDALSSTYKRTLGEAMALWGAAIFSAKGLGFYPWHFLRSWRAAASLEEHCLCTPQWPCNMDI